MEIDQTKKNIHQPVTISPNATNLIIFGAWVLLDKYFGL